VTPTATTGVYSVSCTMASDTQGSASFTGTVSNTSMTGTVTWTIGTKAYTYNYSGVPFTPAVDPES
jgi:hypothetical protein